MKADDFPLSPHISFAIAEIESKHKDLLTQEELYDLAIAKQAGKDYNQAHFLRVQYLLDSCRKIRNVEKLLRANYEKN